MTVSSFSVAPKLFVMDIEVDSVKKENGDPVPCITQLCVYEFDKSVPKADRVFEAFVKPPEHLIRKPEEHNFRHGHLVPRKYTMQELWPHLRDHINKKLKPDQSAVFMVYNSDHDWPIFDRELSRIAQSMPRMWKPYDIAWLAITLQLGDKGAFDHKQRFAKLTSLCHKVGAKVLDAHSAYNDTIMLKRAVRKMLGDANLEAVGLAMLKPLTEHPHKAVKNAIRSTAHRVNDAALNEAPLNEGAAVKEAAFLVYDYETDSKDIPDPQNGKNCPWPHVVQMAAYLPELDVSFETLVNPGIPIAPESIKIHHITDDMVKDAPDIKKANQLFDDWLQQHLPKLANREIVLLGHNILDYDEKIRKHDREMTGLPYREYKCLDTCRLARSLFAGIKADKAGAVISKKLQRLRKGLGIPEDKAHDAAGDVRVNWKVFRKLTVGLTPEQINQSVFTYSSAKNLATMIKDQGAFSPIQYLEPPKTDDEAAKPPKNVPKTQPVQPPPAAAQKPQDVLMLDEEVEFEEERQAPAAAAASAATGPADFDVEIFDDEPAPLDIPAAVAQTPKKEKRKLRVPSDDEGDIAPTKREKLEKPAPASHTPTTHVEPVSPSLAAAQKKTEKAFGKDSKSARQVQLSDAFLNAKSLQRPDAAAPKAAASEQIPAAATPVQRKPVLPIPAKTPQAKPAVPTAAQITPKTSTIQQPPAAPTRQFGLVDSTDSEGDPDSEVELRTAVPKTAPKLKPVGKS